MSELIPKSYWERKEGAFGMFISSAILVSIGVGVYSVLPQIILLLTNTLYTIYLACGLFVIVALLTNGTIQTLLWNIFKSFTTFTAGLFVTVDPVGIVRNYIADLKVKRNGMSSKIKDLRVHISKLNADISKSVNEINHNATLAQKAKDNNNQGEYRLKARKMGRRENSVKSLNELKDKMVYLLKILEKIYLNSGYKIDDLEDDVNNQIRAFKSSKGARSAISSALSLLKTDSDKEIMFTMSMDHMADEMSSMVGELDEMLFVTSEISSSIDLENGVYEDKGFSMLEEWDNKADKLFLDDAEMQELRIN